VGFGTANILTKNDKASLDQMQRFLKWISLYRTVGN